MTAAVGRIIYQWSDATTARLGFKLGSNAVELDLGGTHRVGESSTVGLSVSVGMQVWRQGPEGVCVCP